MCLVQGYKGLQGVGVLSCPTTVTLEVASLFTHQTPTHHHLVWSRHWGHSRGRGDRSLLGQSQHPSAGGGKISLRWRTFQKGTVWAVLEGEAGCRASRTG